jgi:hypothetical protein
MGRVIAASALSRAQVISGRRYWSQWDQHCQDRNHLRGNGRVAAKEVNVDFSRYTPDKYLLSWFTAVAGVELEKDGHTIKSAHNHFINDNGNAWSNQVLLESYHSFIMAENFVEHVSIPEFSKGKVLDAVAWIIEKQFNGYREPIPTVFIDVLLATSKKRHPLLVKKVINGVLNNVSMGCLLPDGLVTMADGTQREIQSILVGDFVMTEQGGVGEVVDVQIRDVVDEDIYEGDIVGITGDFILTGEHPVMFAQGARADIEIAENSRLVLPHVCGGPTLQAGFFTMESQGDYWHRNYPISNKMYAAETYPKEIWLPSEMVTEEFAELLGMLAGDGYFCGVNGYETRLCSNTEYTEIDYRAHLLMEKVFGYSIDLEHQECDIVVWLQASSEQKTNLLKKFLSGRTASEKKFAPEVIYWPHHLQKALLRGYFNADGDFSRAEILKAESRSQDLRDQVYLMLLRNGIVANRCRLLHKPTGFSKGDSYYMYIVMVGRGYNKEWMCEKVAISDPGFVGKSPTFPAQSFMMRKVKEFIKKKYTGKVYNLTIGGAHTYTHCGVVVHNCDILWSVCSRCGKEIEEGYDEVCDHIKNQLGKYYVDKKGVKRRVAELCGRPGVKDSCSFKEVSLVSRPAFLWARMHGFLEYSDVSSGRPLRAIVPISRYKESNREV